jgi:hypothetical protein
LICVFNKINEELYVSINNNKYVNFNQRLNWKAKIKIHIKIYDLILPRALKKNYLIIQ